MSVLGYVCCTECGESVLDIVAYKTGGQCSCCYRAHFNERVADIEIVGRQMRVTTPSELPKSEAAQAKTARKRKAAKTPESRRAEKLREQAKQAAFRRMRDLLPELFEVLVADERAKRGLKPWTIDAALTPGTAQETLQWLADYHTRRGTAVDR